MWKTKVKNSFPGCWTQWWTTVASQVTWGSRRKGETSVDWEDSHMRPPAPARAQYRVFHAVLCNIWTTYVQLEQWFSIGGLRPLSQGRMSDNLHIRYLHHDIVTVAALQFWSSSEIILWLRGHQNTIRVAAVGRLRTTDVQRGKAEESIRKKNCQEHKGPAVFRRKSLEWITSQMVSVLMFIHLDCWFLIFTHKRSVLNFPVTFLLLTATCRQLLSTKEEAGLPSCFVKFRGSGDSKTNTVYIMQFINNFKDHPKGSNWQCELVATIFPSTLLLLAVITNQPSNLFLRNKKGAGAL